MNRAPTKAAGVLRFRYPFLTGCALIAALVFCLYSVSLGHNFLFDEENIILKNPLIRDLAEAPELFKNGFFYFESRSEASWKQYYRPLTSLTFALNYRFSEVNPFGYNLTNVFLHILVSLCFFKLLIEILGNKTAAFLAALLYAVHPIHTEAVTYIASRSDLLAGLLLVAAMLFYKKGKVAAAFFCYAPALLAKESAILLPFYLLFLDLCFIEGGGGGPRRDVARYVSTMKRLAPFALLAIGFLIFRKFFCPIPFGPASGLRETALRFLSMGPPFLSYLEALVLPETFKFSLEMEFAQRFGDPKVWTTLLVITLLLAGWFAALRRRGPAFFGMSLFLFALSPYLQLIHFYPTWAEHYLYIPAMGLAVLFGEMVKQLFKIKRRILSIFCAAAYAGFILFLCARTWQRNVVYNSEANYYERLAHSHSPYVHYGYENLGALAMREKDWPHAIIYLRVAYSFAPTSGTINNWLGFYYLQTGEPARAIPFFKKAYRVSRDYGCLNNLGVALTRTDHHQEAIFVFKKIQRTLPQYLQAYTNALLPYEFMGKAKEGLAWGSRGLGILDRDSERAYLAMAMARMAYRQGWFDQTRAQAETISRNSPDVFWYGDVVKLLKGDLSEEAFRKILGSKYAGLGYGPAGEEYLLMSFVLQKKWEKVALVLADPRNELRRIEKTHPFIRQELNIARLAVPQSATDESIRQSENFVGGRAEERR